MGKNKFWGPWDQHMAYLKWYMVWQPLPTPLARWIFFFPEWIHKVALIAMFLAEIVLPFWYFLDDGPRVVSAVVTVLLQIGIWATGALETPRLMFEGTTALSTWQPSSCASHCSTVTLWSHSPSPCATWTTWQSTSPASSASLVESCGFPSAATLPTLGKFNLTETTQGFSPLRSSCGPSIW